MKKILLILGIILVCVGMSLGQGNPVGRTEINSYWKGGKVPGEKALQNIWASMPNLIDGGTITTTLNVVGNTTWNTNQTNTLTTGNTGTVAVLSDVKMTLPCTFSILSPVDATTYYFGTIMSASAPETSSNLRTCKIPYNCILVGASINTFANTGGSAESSTVSIRINNATDVQLSASVPFYTVASAGVTQTTVTGLSTSITAGDTYEIKWLCPTWATNPLNTGMQVTLYFSPR